MDLHFASNDKITEEIKITDYYLTLVPHCTLKKVLTSLEIRKGKNPN
jgi:hypothetical protein